MYRTAIAAVGVSICLTLSVKADVVVSISKSQQRLAVTVDGNEIYRWPVSTGRRGLETPSGDFQPIRLEAKWYSRKYDWAPMPWSIFFHKGYAVHGSYEVKRLGQPASHGCVRLLPANASTLFNLVREQGKNSTRIVVMNGPLPELPAPQPAPLPAPEPGPKPMPVPKPIPAIDPKASIAGGEPAPMPQPDNGKAQRAAEDLTSVTIKAKVATAAPPPVALNLPRFDAPEKAAVVPASIAVPRAPAPIAEPPVAKFPEHRPLAAVPPDVPPPAPRLPAHRLADAKPKIGKVHSERDFTAAGDEASVRRGREAWLRSLDRKYGIK